MSPTTSTSSTVPAKVAGATELPSDAPAQDVAQHDNEENAKQGHPHNASGDKSGLNGGGDTSSHADHNLSKKKPEQVVEDEATGNSSNEGSLSAKRSGTAIQTRTGSEEEDTDGEQDAEADGSSAGHETAAETAGECAEIVSTSDTDEIYLSLLPSGPFSHRHSAKKA